LKGEISVKLCVLHSLSYSTNNSILAKDKSALFYDFQLLTLRMECHYLLANELFKSLSIFKRRAWSESYSRG